jgi:hypothetical protein
MDLDPFPIHAGHSAPHSSSRLSGSPRHRTRAQAYNLDLKAFFDFVPDILALDGVFSFWNGLGATSE